MPGLVAAVNPSIVVPDNMTKVYDLSYIYGFFSSGLVYAFLHKAFPARNLDAFVSNDVTAKELQAESRWKWDDLHYKPGIIDAAAVKDGDDADEGTKLDTAVKILPY